MSPTTGPAPPRPPDVVAGALVDGLRGVHHPVPDVAAAVALLRDLRRDLDELPPPGLGHTAARWDVLVEAGAGDLGVARLLEGHLDARAILHEAGRRPPEGLLGVWAADPPHGRVDAARAVDGWRLSGVKRFCAGARHVDGALVTAHADDGYRLFSVERASWHAQGSWLPSGLAVSDTVDVAFEDVPAEPVGPPGWYLDRPGFWTGAIGVGAIWHGAAVGSLDALRAALDGVEDEGPLALLGALDVDVAADGALVAASAHLVDADPDGDHRRLALRVRSAAVRTARAALDRVQDAVGARLVVGDPVHARRAADLPVYAVQHHGCHDLAALGRDVAGDARG